MLELLKNAVERLPVAQRNREIINLPNLVSLLRICVIPVLFLLLLSPGKMMSLLVAAFFVFAAATDFLDGYIARRFNIVTTMGKFLDPVADKLIINTAMILMIPIGRIPAWIVAVIIMRDLLVDGLRSVASADGVIIQAGMLGKQKTVCQDFAVTALIIYYPFFGLNAHAVGMVLLYISFFLTLVSGAEYFIKFHRQAIRK
jgi:CDP-diacylglycerol---glycerol-3-phosphate 3-phosphatidyltransferase